MILFELKVDQPQFYSVGAALLGMLMHYLLMRAGSNTGAFITGMVSQLVLLSTTYIQMVGNNSLGYFSALFFQSLVVLAYGLVIRSRSLVFTPIAFVVLGVFTVVSRDIMNCPNREISLSLKELRSSFSRSVTISRIRATDD